MNSIVFSPIECLSLSLSEKKHHQQPDAVRAVVDAVAAAPDKDLAPLLPTDAGGLWASWGWFALGIEGGQLLVVAAVFSLKWMASARGFNPRDFALALGAICRGVSLHLASQWYLE